MIPTLFFVVLITFTIMHATPGGPWDISPDSRTSDPRIQAALDKQYGLNKPLYGLISRMRRQLLQKAGPRSKSGRHF